MLSLPSIPARYGESVQPGPATARRAAAEALETTFLAEMLKSTGLGEQENSFSGSAGESQFASFHREAIAREIVRTGGLGLADMIEASIEDKTRDGK